MPLTKLPAATASITEAKTEEFILGVARLFQKDDDFRATVWKALERSKDELKIDRPRLERHFTRVIRSYSHQLNHNSGTSMERDTAKFVRHNSRSIAIAVLQTVQPIPTLQHRMALLLNQAVEKLALDRFFETLPVPEDVSRIKAAGNRPQNWQTVEQRNTGEVDGSSDGSEASYEETSQIDDSLEMVEAFLVVGEPFTNLKQQFREFVAGGTLDDASKTVEICGDQQGSLVPSRSNVDSGLVRIQWRCVSLSTFSIHLQERKYLSAYALYSDVAINFRRTYSNTKSEPPRTSFVTCIGTLAGTVNIFQTYGHGSRQ